MLQRRSIASTGLWGVAAALLLTVPGQPSFAAAAARCSPTAPGEQTLAIRSGSSVRQVRLYVPVGHDGSRRLPLVFDLHGSNGNGAQQAQNSGFARTAEKHGFVVAWPDGGVTLPGAPDQHFWNIYGLPLTGNRPMPADAPDDVQFFSDAIDQIAATHCIDMTRVYAAGHSGGGRMSSLLACRLTSRIAAVAPVVGLRAGMPLATDPTRPDPQSCQPSRAIPVITFHGTDDRTNPYAGGGNDYWQYGVETAVARWAEMNGCSATPTVTRLSKRVERRRFEGCRDGATVEFNRIDAPSAEGGGHTWPGSLRRREPPPGGTPDSPSTEIDASERIWTFFAQYHL